MMDDLVERLRNEMPATEALLNQAADMIEAQQAEIERLRANIRNLNAIRLCRGGTLPITQQGLIDAALDTPVYEPETES